MGSIHIHIEQPWRHHTSLSQTHLHLKTLTHFATYPHTSSRLVIKTHYASEHLSTNTVYPHHLPHRLSVHSIICLLQIHERNPHFPFLFLHFLANLPQDKNLIRAAPSFPLPSLFPPSFFPLPSPSHQPLSPLMSTCTQKGQY